MAYRGAEMLPDMTQRRWAATVFHALASSTIAPASINPNPKWWLTTQAQAPPLHRRPSTQTQSDDSLHKHRRPSTQTHTDDSLHKQKLHHCTGIHQPKLKVAHQNTSYHTTTNSSKPSEFFIKISCFPNTVTHWYLGMIHLKNAYRSDSNQLLKALLLKPEAQCIKSKCF